MVTGVRYAINHYDRERADVKLASRVEEVSRVAAMTDAQFALYLMSLRYVETRPAHPIEVARRMRSAAAGLRLNLWHVARAGAPSKSQRDRARARMADLLAAADKAEELSKRRVKRGVPFRVNAYSRRRILRDYLADPENEYWGWRRAWLRTVSEAVDWFRKHGRGLVSTEKLDAIDRDIAARADALAKREQEEAKARG